MRDDWLLRGRIDRAHDQRILPGSVGSALQIAILVAPVLVSRTHFVTTDVDREMDQARERLSLTLDWARTHGLSARGHIGDPMHPDAQKAFQKLARYNEATWQRMVANARKSERAPEALPIFGSDLYGRSLGHAVLNMREAGLDVTGEDADRD